jgi:transposase-like protein
MFKERKEQMPMRRRQWSSREKFTIVLEGLKGESEIGTLCARHKISTAQYRRWREQFMQFGHYAFDLPRHSLEEKRLREENRRLKLLLDKVRSGLQRITIENGPQKPLRKPPKVT